MPAALQMQAPELVRGHFYEPSIAVKSIKGWPMFDPGLLRWKRRSSLLRLAVHTFLNNLVPLFSVTAQDNIELLMPKTLSCGFLV